MLKLFIRQLSNSVFGFQPLLVEAEARAALKSDNEERYIDVIANTLKLTQHKVCAFVDGLDEYEGDLWELGTVIERLRDRIGMKMCLAGRPETALEAMFGKYPSITMQDHNRLSMQVYIDRKVSKLLVAFPFVQHLFPKSLRDAIVNKAQGVILWATLVVDEMVKSCNDTTTSVQMLAILDSLPADLEPLYERILGKTNERYQRETALILTLIIENPGLTTPTLLYQAWGYLRETHLQEPGYVIQSDGLAYESRLKALLGNLVDFVPLRGNRFLHWSYVLDHDTSVSVRLIHKSLSTYLDRSSWILHRLPNSFFEMYPNLIWRRMAFAILEDLDREDALNIGKIQAAMQARKDKSTSTTTPIVRFEKNWLQSSKWYERQELLLYCAANCFDIDVANYLEHGKSDVAMNFNTSSSMASLLHYMRCRKCLDCTASWWDATKIQRIYDHRLLGWVLNVLHGSYDWAAREFSILVSRLPQRSAEDLFDLALLLQPWRNGERDSSHYRLLQKFSHHGLCVEGRHMCSLLVESSGVNSLRARAIISAASLRAKGQQWLIAHDQDCFRDLSKYGTWSHWLECQYGSTLMNLAFSLRIFVLLGAKVDQQIDSHLHESILDTIVSNSSQNPCASREMLYAAITQGARPSIEDIQKLLEYARKCSRQPDKTSRDSHKHSARGSKARKDSALNDMISTLEFYRTNGSKWPALTTQSQRVSEPQFRVDTIHNQNSWGDFDTFELYKILKHSASGEFDSDGWLGAMAKQASQPNAASPSMFFNQFYVVIGSVFNPT